ncbi:MAG: hypothetical protein HZB26_00615 [Candidatus Hydrogenedentes bacterium]|nr:hypothetical protein [Candidatus Hydrogenedentota bacterium]
MKSAPPKKCGACDGRGWLLMCNTDEAAFEIQRCDACERFSSDPQAQEFIARNKSTLVEALFEFCDAVLADAARAVNEKELSHTGMKCRMKMIRDSLQNAVDLHSKHKAKK